jgi:hypothetical protein
VAPDNFIEAPSKRLGFEPAIEMQGGGFVVRGIAREQLIKEPETLLFEGELMGIRLIPPPRYPPSRALNLILFE